LTENSLYPYVAVLEEFQEIHLNFPRFDCTKTVEALEGSSIYCPEVNKKLFSTYIDFLIDVGFLPEPKILV
jgi:hypothetical protein